MADWQPTRVTVAMGDPTLDAAATFNAFSNGQTWNGWAVPYFTAAVGQKIADWTALVARRSFDPGAQDAVYWDEGLNSFILESHAYPDDPEREVIEGHHVEELDQTLYGIGAFRWAWESA